MPVRMLPPREDEWPAHLPPCHFGPIEKPKQLLSRAPDLKKRKRMTYVQWLAANPPMPWQERRKRYLEETGRAS